ncbi:MAG TPA: hypothetical protein VJ698_19670 [Noviherbaspirillum sp.]|uniref:hypothetical protein n=1 Tax=Noviherbaspirillum sp. TaxID=1926288 RepID=UPI002B496833|nr:hypothetical protein [Noviherbaspirillum sp.]HJV87698.1 hypothetical protein [Noviherbaspirillum sp.]
MKITDEMLTAAVTKAVEAGLLPRRSLKDDIAEARMLMHEILSAALDNRLRGKSGAQSISQWAPSPYPMHDGVLATLPRQARAAGLPVEP